jgi:hypothetical protein
MKGWHNKSWTFILQFRCEETAETTSFDQTGFGAQQAFHSMSNWGFFSTGSNNIRPWTDQSPVPTATAKNEGSYNSTPSYVSWRAQKQLFFYLRVINWTTLLFLHNTTVSTANVNHSPALWNACGFTHPPLHFKHYEFCRSTLIIWVCVCVCVSIRPTTLFNYEPSGLHTNVLLSHSFKYSCQKCSLETILNPGIQF